MEIRKQVAVLAFWLGLTVTAAHAQAPAFRGRQGVEPGTPDWGIFGIFMGTKKPAEPPKPEAAAPVVQTPAVRARDQKRHFDDMTRRLAVCGQLETIAAQTNNHELEEQAYRLEALAMKVYEQKTGLAAGSGRGLTGSGGGSARATLEANSPGGADRARPVREPASAGVREGDR